MVGTAISESTFRTDESMRTFAIIVLEAFLLLDYAEWKMRRANKKKDLAHD